MSSLYNSVILEQSRNKEHRRCLKNPLMCEKGHNPSCGDEIDLMIDVKDGRISDMSYTGCGCAISQASTSMMIDLLKGRTTEEVIELSELFLKMVRGEITEEEALEPLEDTAIFETVSKLPARVKCATLPWYTIIEMLKKGERDGVLTVKHSCAI